MPLKTLTGLGHEPTLWEASSRVFEHPLGKEITSNAQPKLPLTQLCTIPMCLND